MKKVCIAFFMALFAGCSYQVAPFFPVKTTPIDLAQTIPEVSVPVLCQEYFQGLLNADSAMVKSFESCLKTRDNAFKKFAIPNTAADYYMFMGNNLVSEHLDPICSLDQPATGCLLYKVTKGKPLFLSSESLPHLPYEAKKGPLLLSSIEGVRSDGALVFSPICYEMCGGYGYEVRDFEHPIQNGEETIIPESSSIYFSNGEMLGEQQSWLRVAPQADKEFIITIEFLAEPKATITLRSLDEIVAVFDVKATELGNWDKNAFPSRKEVRDYAFQKDASKFMFTLEGKRHALDLSGAMPELLY